MREIRYFLQKFAQKKRHRMDISFSLTRLLLNTDICQKVINLFLRIFRYIYLIQGIFRCGLMIFQIRDKIKSQLFSYIFKNVSHNLFSFQTHSFAIQILYMFFSYLELYEFNMNELKRKNS